MAHLLEMKNICKSFSGVSVLKNNHLELEAGEVHSLFYILDFCSVKRYDSCFT